MGTARLRIGVSGASGLVGSACRASWMRAGHDVVRLVWRVPVGPPRDSLEGLDAVVHLAGANIADGRWSAARKRVLRESRTEGTRLLVEALAALARPPRVLVSASAIGYYGDRGDETLDEESAQGTGFLAEMCAAWEGAAQAASARGIRVVLARIGIVLDRSGGALARMLPPFRLGLGGRLGHGRQFMSFISLEDVVATLSRAIEDETFSGPFNATSPEPVRNAEFARVLGRLLRRPAVLPLPALVIKAVFGEMGRAILLGGNRVLPARLERAGFRFAHRDVESTLRAALGRA